MADRFAFAFRNASGLRATAGRHFEGRWHGIFRMATISIEDCPLLYGKLSVNNIAF
jgi:hypothetical protein